MKIKVAFLEKDRGYLTNMVPKFGAKFADKLEIYSFTDLEVALGTLKSAKIDVLLASDSFEIELHRLPARCAFAYLVDSQGIEAIRDQLAICKYQKSDLLYKQILSVYSEKASAITGYKFDGDKGRIIAFCSASGGVGSSTMAAACAMRMASLEKKVLYLNLETFGSSDVFFSGDGQYDMSDVIFALKSKKANLPMKLESCVKQDESGVYFYSQAKIALDMMELTTEDILRLISEFKLMGEYDTIILDMEFGLDRETLKIFREAETVVLVGDGSASSNAKTERAYAALSIMEQSVDAPLTDRLTLVYNKVSSLNGVSVNAEGLKVLGGEHFYSGGTPRKIINEISRKNIFDAIL